MSLLDLLDDKDTWKSFLSYKLDKGHMPRREEQALKAFIDSEAYLPAAQTLKGGAKLPPPQMIHINKLGTARKRIVYSFEEDVMWVLKLLAWLLYAYDAHQPEGCYSFRRNYGAHRAFRDIIRTPDINGHWCCKLDISDYFNSIQIPRMLSILQTLCEEDGALFAFFEHLLTADVFVFDGVLHHEKRGAMAGIPTAPFLANLYLRELDAWFVERGLPYARYSDDIIIFAKSAEEIQECLAHAKRIIGEHGLKINMEKASLSAPGESWEFLGMSYHAGTIDISEATKAKLKGKIRRKARSLRRWMLRKNATSEQAQRALIRSFNRKFYGIHNESDLTWSRWFFPLLTTSVSIREIDHYLQLYVRYLSTGHFNGANYRLCYKDIKAYGYRSLVHEYYLSRTLRQK